MRDNMIEPYIGKKVLFLIEGDRNACFFGKLKEIKDHNSVLENERGPITIQNRQVVAVSPFKPKPLDIGDAELDEVTEEITEKKKNKGVSAKM